MIAIKNIIFDLGGVILKSNPISILDNLNIDKKTYDTLKCFFYDWNNLDLGYESLQEKFENCNFSIEYTKLYKDILINYYKYRDINKYLIELIGKLKCNNYRVYILSDNNKEAFNYYKNTILKNVDGFIISCYYNTLKKEGKLFSILLDKYNLSSSECYFIDNNIINIDIASKYGIKGYLFNELDDINKLYIDMNNNSINI